MGEKGKGASEGQCSDLGYDKETQVSVLCNIWCSSLLCFVSRMLRILEYC